MISSLISVSVCWSSPLMVIVRPLPSIEVMPSEDEAFARTSPSSLRVFLLSSSTILVTWSSVSTVSSAWIKNMNVSGTSPLPAPSAAEVMSDRPLVPSMAPTNSTPSMVRAASITSSARA